MSKKQEKLKKEFEKISLRDAEYTYELVDGNWLGKIRFKDAELSLGQTLGLYNRFVTLDEKDVASVIKIMRRLIELYDAYKTLRL